MPAQKEGSQVFYAVNAESGVDTTPIEKRIWIHGDRMLAVIEPEECEPVIQLILGDRADPFRFSIHREGTEVHIIDEQSGTPIRISRKRNSKGVEAPFAVITIGRDMSNTVRVFPVGKTDLALRAVSRKHVMLYVTDAAVYVRDTSTNGTGIEIHRA